MKPLLQVLNEPNFVSIDKFGNIVGSLKCHDKVKEKI